MHKEFEFMKRYKEKYKKIVFFFEEIYVVEQTKKVLHSRDQRAHTMLCAMHIAHSA